MSSTIRLAAAGILLVLFASGVLLVRDALAVEPLLRAIEDDLVTAAAAVEDGDDASARSSLDLAADGVAAARRRVDGPLWSAAGAVPRFGASARAVTGGVDLADATTELATVALEEVLTLLDDGASAFIGPGGRVDTSTLTATADELDRLPVDPVANARDRLAALPASGLVGPTRTARDTAVARATMLLDQVERGRTGARVFSTFLGGDRPRTYLLAVQNNGELRGTGGLFSYLAELTIDDGLIDIRPSVDQGLVDDLITRSNATIRRDLENPVARTPEFASRYDSNGGATIIQSVNLDPDLPTVGPVLLAIYADRTGRTLDGAILTDPFVLQAILGATGGPLEIPADMLAAAPGLPARLTSSNAAQTLLIDVYDEFGGLNPLRRTFDELVTLAVFERLTAGGWEPPVLARALGDATAARRMQLYSTDVDEQAGFVALGVAGSMPTAADAGDFLAVTGVNAGPDKSDVHVSHRLSADITLQTRPGAAPAQIIRDAEITVEVDNPLRPDDHDDYITGTNEPVPLGSGSSPRVRDATNRTWFTIWSPDSTELRSLRDGIADQVLRTGSIHGHNAIDYFLETPSASTAAWSAPYSGPLELEQADGRYLYELLLWRQAKGIADEWDVRVTAPRGLVIDEVSVEGGGAPTTGLGPAAPQPLEAVIEPDGFARLTGTVTRDTRLRVWFVAG